MSDIDLRLRYDLGRQMNMVTRCQVLAAGGTDDMIEHRLRCGRWTLIHPGVYLAGATLSTFPQRLLAACLASGPEAAISHRCAAALWGLDGFREGMVELTVPHRTEVVPTGVVTHRSRRIQPGDYTVRGGIPVFVVERVLTEIGRFVPAAVVEKAVEDALRRRLTTETRLWAYLDEGAIHLLGARKLRRVLLVRTPGRPAGSPAEVEFLRAVRRVVTAAPLRQYEIRLPDGSAAVVDFAWPTTKLVVEIDGRLAHDGRRSRSYDQARDRGLSAMGWRVHRIPAAAVQRDPAGSAVAVAALLGGKTRA